MTLQSKILKTKKRLSDERWALPIGVTAFFSVFVAAFTSMRVANLSQAYGSVRAEIPVLHVPLKDKSYHRYEETAGEQITQHTTAVVLNNKGQFVFGDLAAFSTEFHQVRNKFRVDPIDGQPQIAGLLDYVDKWKAQRQKRQIKDDGIAVFLPASGVPMAVVTQVLHYLKESKSFNRVVLAYELK